MKEDADGGIRRSVQGLNRLREIVERLKELQISSYAELSTPIAVVGEELRSVFAALEQAVPLIEVLSSPFSSKDADDIDRAVDDAKRFRMLAADLREHAGRATLAAECVEEAARGVEALRAKVTEREKLKTLGIDLDPVIRL
jgi:hypothetical protein